jgi:hypothetical protein
MGLHKGCKGNNPLGNPHWAEVRNKYGVKPGSIRGKYKTKRSFQQLMEEMHPETKPKLALVNDPAERIDPLEYLNSVVSNPATTQRDRIGAALGVLPYVHTKAEGKYLSLNWDMPAPATVEEAQYQIRMVNEMLRRQKIKDTEATKLIEGITALYPTMERLEIVREIMELKNKVEGRAPIIDVFAEGGLPQLPGNENMILNVKPENPDKMGTSDGSPTVPESTGGIESIDPADWRSDQT